MNKTNPIREQVIAAAPAIKEQFWELERRARLLLTTPEIFSVRRIVMCGCGDSRMAAQSAKMAFEKYSGIPIEVVRALEASRYTAQFLLDDSPKNPLVILISSSGEVARVVEAAQQFRKKGALTVAVTSNPESRLAKNSEKVLQFAVPSLPSAPGFYSFAASLIILYLVAFRLGEVRGKLTQTQAQEKRKDLAQQLDNLEETIAPVDAAAYELALAWQGLSNFEFLGSGPGYGTASFGAAKILEATGANAWPQDLEEWAHLQYFIAKPEAVGTFIIAPPESMALSRTLEITRFVEQLKRPHAVVSGGGVDRLYPAAQKLFLTKVVPEEFSPLIYSVPLALFAGYLADATSAAYGRGHQGRWAGSKAGAAVRNSELLEYERQEN